MTAVIPVFKQMEKQLNMVLDLCIKMHLDTANSEIVFKFSKKNKSK